MTAQRRSGPMARWWTSFGVSLGLSLLVYALAIYSYSTAYLASASSDEQGWMFVLFPLLMLPPGLAWAKIALPAAAGLAFQHPAAKAAGAFGALLVSTAADVIGHYETPLIGTLNPFLFKTAVWIAAAIGSVIALRIFASEDRKSGEL